MDMCVLYPQNTTFKKMAAEQRCSFLSFRSFGWDFVPYCILLYIVQISVFGEALLKL